jgi:hypothetical protein
MFTNEPPGEPVMKVLAVLEFGLKPDRGIEACHRFSQCPHRDSHLISNKRNCRHKSLISPNYFSGISTLLAALGLGFFQTERNLPALSDFDPPFRRYR